MRPALASLDRETTAGDLQVDEVNLAGAVDQLRRQLRLHVVVARDAGQDAQQIARVAGAEGAAALA